MGDGDRARRQLTDRAVLLDVAELLTGYSEAIVGPISFTVGDGDIVGVAGPNGSGKTTIVNAIIGIARVFGGAITRLQGTRVSVQRQHPVRLREMPLTGRELLRLTGAFDRPIPTCKASVATREGTETRSPFARP